MSNKVDNILSQILIFGDCIESKSSGKSYTRDEFFKLITARTKLSKDERQELSLALYSYLKPQTDQSVYVENLINKYDISFCDGIYFIGGKIYTINDVYKLMWEEERLLPSAVDVLMQDIEKIKPKEKLQWMIYQKILDRAINGESEYLKTLDKIYPEINFRRIIYNILTPNSKPLFHIFYDDGVGGTGKSTLLEVLTKIVGEEFVSNVLLDQFGNRFVFANMLGKYLNVGDDNGKNDELQNVGTLKSIITGGRVTIDRKNLSPIEVRIFAKQLFATNILPYIDFTDGGLMRRLNIVPMNKVIPKNIKLPKLDELEIGRIIYETLLKSRGTLSNDIIRNENTLAITSSPLYRFYNDTKIKEHTYSEYKIFCSDNGFRYVMNIVSFEVKTKFIKHYMEQSKKPQLTLITKDEEDDLPF